MLDEETTEVGKDKFTIAAKDLNGQIEERQDGFTCHGGFGYGTRNSDDEHILEYLITHDLVITNSIFKK